MAKSVKRKTPKTGKMPRQQPAEEEDYEVGDIVELKSGGPRMTVDKTIQVYPAGHIRCQWFAGSKLNSGVFPPDALQRAKDKLGGPVVR